MNNIFNDEFLKDLANQIIARIDTMIADLHKNYRAQQMYLKKKQAQKYLGIGETKLNEFIHEGLPTITHGKCIRIDIRDIDRFMEERKVVECQELSVND